jgi:inhibitor of cysteine peptidase
MSNKRSRFFPFGLLLALAWALGGCADGNRVLLNEDTGRTVEVQTGATLEIKLPGNPTTGYSWEIAKVDARILALQGEIEFQSSSQALGAPGEFTFRFQALAPGSTELLLIYQRPFEVDREPENHFEITVVVSG